MYRRTNSIRESISKTLFYFINYMFSFQKFCFYCRRTMILRRDLASKPVSVCHRFDVSYSENRLGHQNGKTHVCSLHARSNSIYLLYHFEHTRCDSLKWVNFSRNQKFEHLASFRKSVSPFRKYFIATWGKMSFLKKKKNPLFLKSRRDFFIQIERRLKTGISASVCRPGHRERERFSKEV